MEVKLSKSNQVRIMSIHGELDASSCLTMEKHLKSALEENEKLILIDCANLNYISSAGLGVFISYHDSFNSLGGDLVFSCMNEEVRNIFEILGLEQVMKILSSSDEAIRILNETSI